MGTVRSVWPVIEIKWGRVTGSEIREVEVGSDLVVVWILI